MYHSIKDKYPYFFPLSLRNPTQRDFREQARNYSYDGITNAKTNHLKALTVPSYTLFSVSVSLTNIKGTKKYSGSL